jgi:hypothetical protein
MKSAASWGDALMSKTIWSRAAASECNDGGAASSREKSGTWQRARTWWKQFRQISQRRPRRLRLCESLPLGEHRFVAVVEFERSRFLVGGTSASLVLLAQLGNAQSSNDEKNEGDKKGKKDKREQENEKDENPPPHRLADGISEGLPL